MASASTASPSPEVTPAPERDDNVRSSFEKLPDELVVTILLKLPFEMLWSGVCQRVCKQWERIMKSASVSRFLREGRWAAYEARLITPRVLSGHMNAARALAVGPDGRVCVMSYPLLPFNVEV